jgi:hypothetical protein
MYEVLRSNNEDDEKVQITVKSINELEWKGSTMLYVPTQEDFERALLNGYIDAFHREDPQPPKRLPARLNSVVQVLWASIQKLKEPTSSGMSNLPIYIILIHTVFKAPTILNLKELTGKELVDFLNKQLVVQKIDVSSTQGLFFKNIISRDKQIMDMTAGIIRQYISCCLKLSRSQDDVLFEVRGPVGSGKTHFLHYATAEIVRRLKTDKGFQNDAQKQFSKLWSISCMNNMKMPTDWLEQLVQIIENRIKVFASQRNGLSWSNFSALNANQYIAALLAIHYLSPKGYIFSINNFKTTTLSLPEVLQLIKERYGNSLLIEVDIDEIQVLIDNNNRQKTSAHELLRNLHNITAERRDILFITVVGGTTFPANDDDDAKNNMNFASLSGVSTYVLALGSLGIRDTVLKLMSREYPDETREIIAHLGSDVDLVNLLSLIGPFPRTVEMLIRAVWEVQKNSTPITARKLYHTVRDMLVVKYATRTESMLSASTDNIALVLLHILQGEVKLHDRAVQEALLRGLVCYDHSTISIIFMYLHMALCGNDKIKGILDTSFLDHYVDAVLDGGGTHARTMEEIIGQFIAFKTRLYQVTGQRTVQADIFFKGASLGKKIHSVTLELGDTQMTCYMSTRSTEDYLKDVTNIEVNHTKINMKTTAVSLIIGNQCSACDGLISFPKPFVGFEAKKQENTSCVGTSKDSFEHEQDKFEKFVKISNIDPPVLFLYCNAGVTNRTQFATVAHDYSMLVERDNWTDFFKILPKIYITKTQIKY